MVARIVQRNDPPMAKRIAVAVLWFFAGWYLGAFTALMTGTSDLLGPLVAILAAVLFAGDPFGVIWKSSRHATASNSPSAAASAFPPR